MGLNSLRRLSRQVREHAFAALRTFPVLGLGGTPLWRKWRHLHPAPPAETPRDADLLLLCGEIPASWRTEVETLFETMGLPRAVLWLQPAAPAPTLNVLPLKLRLEEQAIGRFDSARFARSLLADRVARQALLPNEAPAPWQGVGPYGQGGEGMMGGKPYGRPMAMTADDPDQLMLDDVPTHLGPFLPYWPAGLGLTLRMQGERIRVCETVRNFFAEKRTPDKQASALTVAEFARARLGRHLGWASDFLSLAGFTGKFLLFSAAIEAGYAWLAIIAAVNSVLSLYYYLRVLAPMYLGPGQRRERISGAAAGVAIACAAATLILGVAAYFFAGRLS